MSSERREGTQQRLEVYQRCENFLQGLKSLKEAPAENLLNFVDEIGRDLARNVRMSQLRRVLDSFEKIKSAVRTRKEEISVREEIQPLKIHLAYAAGRQGALKPLQRVLSRAIDKVQESDDFKKLSQFIEGLVAYHKFYGGED